MRITVSPYILECDVKAARAYAAILEELSQLSLSMVRIAEDTIAHVFSWYLSTRYQARFLFHRRGA